jgi:hypothetical protein
MGELIKNLAESVRTRVAAKAGRSPEQLVEEPLLGQEPSMITQELSRITDYPARCFEVLSYEWAHESSRWKVKNLVTSVVYECSALSDRLVVEATVERAKEGTADRPDVSAR